MTEPDHVGPEWGRRTPVVVSVRRTRVLVVAVLAGVLVAMPATHDPLASVKVATSRPFKAIAFDYFVLFNPDSVVDQVEQRFPGKGREFTNVWRTRQFEYAWLRSITGRYVDFWTITKDALIHASHAMHVTMTAEDERRLLDAFLHLEPWPDAPDALRLLHESGIRVITIANFSPIMLRSNAEHAGLTGLFDALVSTDENHTYKPDPRAYRLGMERLHLEKHEIVFAAFGGWDAAGAKAFGYPTVWVNRFDQPLEELGIRPDRISTDLGGLLDFVLNQPRAQAP